MLKQLLNFYNMDICIINALKRPSSTLLYLQVGRKTGRTRFIAKNVRSCDVKKIPLSVIASDEVLAEIITKSVWNVRYGHALQTNILSNATKNFINACWDELKKLKPEFCIK